MFGFNSSRLNFDIIRADVRNEMLHEYGMRVSLTGDSRKGTSNSHVKEAYLHGRGPWGHTFLGNVSGVENTMNTSGGASLVAGGTGGVDGLWDKFFSQLPYGTDEIASVSLQGETNRATKAAYYSPRFLGGVLNGFRFGASFAPDSRHHGQDKARGYYETGTSVFARSSLAVGTDYQRPVSKNSTLSLFLVGLVGKNRSSNDDKSTIVKYCPTRSFSLGGNLTYKNWQFAAAWVYKGRGGEFASDYQTAGTSYVSKRAGHAYNVNGGIAYVLGKYVVSVTYMHGQRKTGIVQDTGRVGKASVDMVSTSLDRLLFPGLKVYTEITHGKFRNHDAQKEALIETKAYGSSTASFRPNNRFTVAVVGFSVNF